MLLIQGGLIKTITQGDIRDGQILIDDGKIVSIGQKVDAPDGCGKVRTTTRCPVRSHRRCAE